MGRAFEFRKSRKLKRWSAMSKAFTRIGKDIVLAVKENGPDPLNNSKLRAIIQNAKSVNMPKDNIDRAIKKASDKNQKDLKKIVFEGFGPFGIAIVIETATDNNTRTVANIRSYFNKYSGNLGISGSVVYLFDHKCFFQINAAGLNIEVLELEFIDYGLEEIFSSDGHFFIYAPFESFGTIQAELESRNIEIKSSGFERIPKLTKNISQEDSLVIEKLLSVIEEDDDVQHIYHDMRFN